LGFVVCTIVVFHKNSCTAIVNWYHATVSGFYNSKGGGEPLKACSIYRVQLNGNTERTHRYSNSIYLYWVFCFCCSL